MSTIKPTSAGPELTLTEPSQTTDKKSAADPQPKPSKKESVFIRLVELAREDYDEDDVQSVINVGIQEELANNEVAEHYNVLFLYDSSNITRSDADRIYSAASQVNKEKPILLILNAMGGSISAAYFIAKLCREYSPRGFEIAVPRQAKSAATLICCGADKIHLGSLSELGPIDPQFEGVPALALKNSIEHLAELAKRYPAATDFLRTT